MFSLRTLLIAVAIAAIGAVGLTTRNIWWASVMSTLTFGVLLAALVLATSGNGQTRSVALAFAICLATYMAITFSQLFDVYSRSLITYRLLTVTWNQVGVEKPQFTNTPDSFYSEQLVDGENALTPVYGLSGSVEVRDYLLQMRAFFIVGHCLWAYLFGFLGASLATYLHRRANSTPH
jgi:hypothetical protein